MLQLQQARPQEGQAPDGSPHAGPTAKLVGAAAARSHLHKRALSVLSSLQDELHEFLLDLVGHSNSDPDHEDQPLPLLDRTHSALNMAASAHALGVRLPEQHAHNELLLATQQRTDHISRACLNFDDLFTSIEGFLSDLLHAAATQTPTQGEEGGDAAAGQVPIDLAAVYGGGGDIMKEAAATYAAAQRWQQRAQDAQQAASAAQKMAWQKATEAADLTSQATEAETQAEMLRLQGKLPEAMLAIRNAGKLRAAAEEAMRASEALQVEHKARLAEAAEASSKALDISKHAQQLELAGLQQEADAALRHSLRCQSEHMALLQEAQAAQAVADAEAAEAKRLDLRIAKLQADSISAYAAGDIAEGQRLNAEALALQPAAEAAAGRSRRAAERAAALQREAGQLAAEAGAAGQQAEELLSSRERLQGMAAQRHAQRLLRQAAQAMATSQQGHAEADALEALDKTYQRNKAEALRQADELDRQGRHEEAAVQRTAADAWSNLSHLMASSAAATRMEAMRKAEVGASLQRAAHYAMSGAPADAESASVAVDALSELLDPARQQEVAMEAIQELVAMRTGRGPRGGLLSSDPETLHATTEEAQQRAARLNQQLMMAAEHLNAGGQAGMGASSPRTTSMMNDAALDNVALAHMGQTVKLGRLAKAWQEQAVHHRQRAADLHAEAEELDAQAARHDEAATSLEAQARVAEQAGDTAAATELLSRAARERETPAGLRGQADGTRQRALGAAEDAAVAARHAAALAASIHALDEAAGSFQQAAMAAAALDRGGASTLDGLSKAGAAGAMAGLGVGGGSPGGARGQPSSDTRLLRDAGRSGSHNPYSSEGPGAKELLSAALESLQGGPQSRQQQRHSPHSSPGQLPAGASGFDGAASQLYGPLSGSLNDMARRAGSFQDVAGAGGSRLNALGSAGIYGRRTGSEGTLAGGAGEMGDALRHGSLGGSWAAGGDQPGGGAAAGRGSSLMGSHNYASVSLGDWRSSGGGDPGAGAPRPLSSSASAWPGLGAGSAGAVPPLAATLAAQLQAAAQQAAAQQEADQADGMPLPSLADAAGRGSPQGRLPGQAGAGASLPTATAQDRHAPLRAALREMTLGTQLSMPLPTPRSFTNQLLRTGPGPHGQSGQGPEADGGARADPASLVGLWLDAGAGGTAGGGARDGEGVMGGAAVQRDAGSPGGGRGARRDSAVLEEQERRMGSIASNMQGTAVALDELQQDQAAAAELAAAAEQEAGEAVELASRRRAELEMQVAAGEQPSSEAVQALGILELAAQRAVLVRDARAHDAQATTKQVELLQQKLRHLQAANSCLAELAPTTTAAQNAQRAADGAAARQKALHEQAREFETQAADAQMQAEAARQLHTQLTASGRGLEANDVHMSAVRLDEKAAQLVASAAQARCGAVRAGREARHIQHQADTLQQRVEHLQELSGLEQQQALAASHSAQLIFLHAQLLSLATELQAEATAFRLAELEAQLAGQQPDRVHTLAQPRLQERSRALLSASSQLWELVQQASASDAPVLSQLMDQLQQLMDGQEAAALEPLPLPSGGPTQVGVSEGAEEDATAGSGQGGRGAGGIAELVKVVKHGRKVAAAVVRLRGLRQHLAESLVLERAGRARGASVVRSRSLFSDAPLPAATAAPPYEGSGAGGSGAVLRGAAGSLGGAGETGGELMRPPRSVEEAGVEHGYVSEALGSLLRAHEALGSVRQLAVSLAGLERHVADERERAVELRLRARQQREACRPYGEGAQAAGVWAQTLQARHQLSQARAASNAAGMLVAQAESSLRSAQEAEQEADECDMRAQRLEGLRDAVQQTMHKCSQLAGVLCEEAELGTEAGELQQQGGAEAAGQLRDLSVRLRALEPCRVHLAAGVEAARQVCIAREGMLEEGAPQDTLDQLQAQVNAAQSTMQLHESEWQECGRVLRLLDAADKYACQADLCRERVASFQSEGRELQDAAAEAQLVVLRQQAALQATQGSLGRLQEEAQQLAEQTDAMQQAPPNRTVANSRAAQRLTTRHTQVIQDMEATQRQVDQAAEGLTSAQADADSASWRADAATLRQAICGQVGPTLDALAAAHREAAHAQLHAVELGEQVQQSGQDPGSTSSGPPQSLRDALTTAQHASKSASNAAARLVEHHSERLELLGWAASLRRDTEAFAGARAALQGAMQRMQQRAVNAQAQQQAETQVWTARGVVRDAAHQLHLTVEQARAALTLPHTQQQVERLAQQVAEMEASSSRGHHQGPSSSLELDTPGTLLAARNALTHAEASLARQQAQAQLALTRTFTHLASEAQEAHERATDRSGQLQLESEAAATQAAQCAGRAADAAAVGQLTDAVALQFAGLRARRRASDLERETLAQRQLADMAERAVGRLRDMDRATDELQDVIAAAYGLMNKGAGVIAPRPLTSQPFSAYAPPGAEGAVFGESVVSAVTEVCRHAGAATALRLSAAQALMAGVRHASGESVSESDFKSHADELAALEQAARHMAQAGNSECACLLEAAAREARAAADAACRRCHPPGGSADARASLAASGDEHDLALYHYKLLQLGKDREALESQVQLPLQAELARCRAAVTAAEAAGQAAAARVAAINGSIDSCHAALQSAPPEHWPVYEARLAALQPQLAAATADLLAAKQQQTAAEEAHQLATAQQDLVETSMGVCTACAQLLHAAAAALGSQSDLGQAPDAALDGDEGRPGGGASVLRVALEHVSTIEELARALDLDVQGLAGGLSGGPNLGRGLGAGQGGDEGGESEGGRVRRMDRVWLQQHGADALAMAASQAVDWMQTAARLQRSRQQARLLATGEALEQPLGPEMLQATEGMVELLSDRSTRLEGMVQLLYSHARWAASALHGPQGEEGPSAIECTRMASGLDVLRRMAPVWLESSDMAEGAAQAHLREVAAAAAAGAAAGGMGGGGGQVQAGGSAGGARLALHRSKAADLNHQSTAIWEELQMALDVAALWLPDPTPPAISPDQASDAAASPAATAEEMQLALLASRRHTTNSIASGVAGGAAGDSPGSGAADSLTPRSGVGLEETGGSPEGVTDPDRRGVTGSPNDSPLQTGLQGSTSPPAAAPAASPQVSQAASPAQPAGRLTAVPDGADGVVSDGSDDGGAASFDWQRAGGLPGAPPGRLLGSCFLTDMLGDGEKGSSGLADHKHAASGLQGGAGGDGTGGSGGGAHITSGSGGDSSTQLGGQGPATQRQPLPANLTAEQAQLLLAAWRRRLHLTQQAAHLTSQLQEIASHQVQDRQADLTRADEGSLTGTVAAAVGGVAGGGGQQAPAVAAARAARQQLHAAQARVRQADQELQELRQEEEQAGGMVERLQLHAGDHNSLAYLSVVLPSATSSRVGTRGNVMAGLLSPSAATALKLTASRMRPGVDQRASHGAHRISTHFNTWQQPDQNASEAFFASRDRSEPWLIRTAPDPMHAATQRHATTDLAMSVLRATGLKLDSGREGSESGGPGRRTGTSAQDCILGPAQATRWRALKLAVGEQEAAVHRLVTELRQQEVAVAAEAHKQQLKAEQASAVSGEASGARKIDPFLSLLESRQAQATLDNPALAELQAVARAQAERHGRAAEDLTSRHESLAETVRRLTLLHTQLLSDQHALDRGHAALVEAAGLELAAVRADKEAAELLCQALLLAMEHSGPDQLPAGSQSEDVTAALHVMQNAVKSRTEAGLRLRSSALEQGQKAGDAYENAADATVAQLRTIAAALDQHVARLGALHTDKLGEEQKCSERASKAARGSVHVSGSGQIELGQRLSTAANKWRKAAAGARGDALQAAQQADLVRLRAARIREVAEQLESNCKELQQRLGSVLDKVMRDVLQGTRSMALTDPWPPGLLSQGVQGVQGTLPHNTRLPQHTSWPSPGPPPPPLPPPPTLITRPPACCSTSPPPSPGPTPGQVQHRPPQHTGRGRGSLGLDPSQTLDQPPSITPPAAGH